VEINACQEGTKINIEVNEWVLKNIGTYWNVRHHWFQWVVWVPIVELNFDNLLTSHNHNIQSIHNSIPSQGLNFRNCIICCQTHCFWSCSSVLHCWISLPCGLIVEKWKHVNSSRDARQWMMSLICGTAVGIGTTALLICHQLVRTTVLAFHCVQVVFAYCSL